MSSPSTRQQRLQQLAPLSIALLANGVLTAAADSSSSSSSSTSASPSPVTTSAAISATSRASLFDSVDGVTAGGAAIGILAMLAGLTMLIAGFKLFRATLFALGFVVGGALLSTLAEYVFADESKLLTVSGIAFGLGGLVGGVLVRVCRDAVGVFFTGAVAGVQLAAMAHTSVGYRAFPGEPIVPLLVLVVVLGIPSGVLAVRLEKPALILATSFVGASLLLWGVGYFAGDYPRVADLTRYREKDATSGDWVYAIPSAWWIYLSVTLLLAVGGVLLQTKLTARGIEGVGRDDSMDHDVTESSCAVPRRKVVVHARRDHIVDMELGTPNTSCARSDYTSTGLR